MLISIFSVQETVANQKTWLRLKPSLAFSSPQLTPKMNRKVRRKCPGLQETRGKCLTPLKEHESSFHSEACVQKI